MRSNVGILERVDGSFTETDYEAANVLNSFFTSVFTNESLSDIPSLSNKFNGEDLNNISISHQDIIDQLNKLNPNKSLDQIKSIHELLRKSKMALFYLCFIYSLNHYMRVPYQ